MTDQPVLDISQVPQFTMTIAWAPQVVVTIAAAGPLPVATPPAGFGATPGEDSPGQITPGSPGLVPSASSQAGFGASLAITPVSEEGATVPLSPPLDAVLYPPAATYLSYN